MADDEPEPLSLRDILKQQEQQQEPKVSHEDDAPGVPDSDAAGAAVPDNVCDGCVVLPSGGSDHLDSSDGSQHTCNIEEEDSVQDNEDEFNENRVCDQQPEEQGPSAVEIMTEVLLGREPKPTSLSAELLEFEEQMADFEREYGQMHLTEHVVDGTDDEKKGAQSSLQHAVHATYGELYNAVPLDMVFRMKAAMQDIPQVNLTRLYAIC